MPPGQRIIVALAEIGAVAVSVCIDAIDLILVQVHPADLHVQFLIVIIIPAVSTVLLHMTPSSPDPRGAVRCAQGAATGALAKTI